VLSEVALGFGDVNLAGVMGLLLGWPGIVLGLVLAIFLGGFVSLIYIVIMLITRRYKTFAAIPYGPFLVLGGVILIYFREYLIR
jgi:leader peptidase (prepilin peptidase)/N-methyltransferase